MTPDEDAKDEQRKFDGVQQGEILTPQIPDVNDLSDASSSQQAKGGKEGKSTNPAEGQQAEGNQPGEDGQKGDPDPNGDGGQKGGQGQDQKGKQGKEGKNGQQPGENSSLMDKMKDALQNMMNKLKMPNQDGGQQQASNKQGAAEKGAANQQQKGGQKGEKQKGQEGDALVFTGGIGENSTAVRAEACAGLETFGIEIDPEANALTIGIEGTIHRGRVPVWVIPANEELLIARDTEQCLNSLG